MPILPFIEPDWPAPANVVAYCTTRRGGVSRAPHSALNLASHVGDSSAAVAENRERLRLAMGCEMQLSWLDQVHGVAAVEARLQSCPAADAQWSRQPGLACAVMTAEFLAYSKYVGNDLSTPKPEWGFPGLKPGDKWCLCAARFLQAHDEGCAPKVSLKATHARALDVVPLDVLRLYAV